VGQSATPIVVTAMEELASIPDTKARQSLCSF
jgi:hypothetical protein